MRAPAPNPPFALPCSATCAACVSCRPVAHQPAHVAGARRPRTGGRLGKLRATSKWPCADPPPQWPCADPTPHRPARGARRGLLHGRRRCNGSDTTHLLVRHPGEAQQHGPWQCGHGGEQAVGVPAERSGRRHGSCDCAERLGRRRRRCRRHWPAVPREPVAPEEGPAAPETSGRVRLLPCLPALHLSEPHPTPHPLSLLPPLSLPAVHGNT